MYIFRTYLREGIMLADVSALERSSTSQEHYQERFAQPGQFLPRYRGMAHRSMRIWLDRHVDAV